MLRYSSDTEAWTLDTDEELFGDGMFSIGGAVGDDIIIAIVTEDMELWQSRENPLDLPPTFLWVGTPAG